MLLVATLVVCHIFFVNLAYLSLPAHLPISLLATCVLDTSSSHLTFTFTSPKILEHHFSVCHTPYTLDQRRVSGWLLSSNIVYSAATRRDMTH